MGFFDLFRKREKTDKEEVKNTHMANVHISNLLERVAELSSKETENEKHKLQDLWKDIDRNIEEIRKITKSLSEKQFGNGEKIYQRVNMIKDNYVKRISSLLSSAPSFSTKSYRNIENFCNQIKNVVDEMKNVPPKQAIFISKYFKSDIARIVSAIKNLEENTTTMREFISNSMLLFRDKIEKDINEINQLVESLKALNNKAEKIQKNLTADEEHISNLKKKLIDLEKSSEFRKYVEQKDRLSYLKKKKSETEQRIREEFHNAKRPLRKIEYAIARGSGNRADKNKFSSFLHSPVKFVVSNRLKEIESIISSSMTAANLNENELKHLKKFVDSVENGYFDKLAKEYLSVTEEINSLEQAVSSSEFVKIKDDIKRKIEQTSKAIEDYKKGMEQTNRKIDELSKAIEERKNELERKLNKRLGTNIKITLQF
ncbi:MAG: hypothetical protein J7K72_03320 [Candidatus Aenigmarchaeota archaeon]|nr:hypothetical protein [Candidatus Aenigmarchaeota archaeon]